MPAASPALATGYRIEPLAKAHDRSGFRCGVEALDSYFQRQASQDARKGAAAPFVLVDEAAEAVAGFYTLSASAIAVASLPESIARQLPRYPALPATLLGRLAVDARHRGKGYGEKLLLDALRRSFQHSAEIASTCVVVDAKDETAAAFYQKYDFIRLMDNPRALFLPMKEIQALFA
jgi:GNAT superfamily N-acetyltransferase